MSHDQPGTITVRLDAEHAERLKRLAAESQADPASLARVLLIDAIENADLDGETLAEVLAGIPGARERIALGIEQADRGEGIPLEDL